MRDRSNYKLVGHLHVEVESEQTQNYETAAWSTQHILQVGVYPVYAFIEYSKRGFVVDVPTIIKSHYTPALYGGVRVGEYTDTRAGTRDTLTLGYGYYAYTNDVPFKREGKFVPVEDADLRVGTIHPPQFAQHQKFALIQE